MNELQKVRNYTLAKFEADKLVNTITTLPGTYIDTNKDTIFPVVNIDYTSSTVNEDVILVSMTISALDQNEVYTETTDNKLLTDTNYSDIINETFNICQSFINSFKKYNPDNIEISTLSEVRAIINEKLNDLSGHEFDIVLSIPNDGSAC